MLFRSVQNSELVDMTLSHVSLLLIVEVAGVASLLSAQFVERIFDRSVRQPVNPPRKYMPRERPERRKVILLAAQTAGAIIPNSICPRHDFGYFPPRAGHGKGRTETGEPFLCSVLNSFLLILDREAWKMRRNGPDAFRLVASAACCRIPHTFIKNKIFRASFRTLMKDASNADVPVSLL